MLVKCGLVGTKKSSFKFLNVWQKHPTFIQIVSEAWEALVSIARMQLFFNKLMHMRLRLKQWSSQIFGKIFFKVKEAKIHMKECEDEYDFLRDEASKTRLGMQVVYTREVAIECEF